MTDPVFKRGMALMAATWPDKKLKTDTFEVYWLVLKDLHDSVFEAAVKGCLESCKFFPVPAEIIAKATDVLASAGALPAAGEQAWEQVIGALRLWHPDLGWMRPCPFGELVDQAVRALGGVGRVWNASGHELGFIRKEFLDFYDWKREQELRYGPNLLAQALPAPKERVLLEGKQ